MNPDDVRVLVVDDIADAAEALATLLTLNGYDTRTATDGASALALLDDFKPHCILLDIQMPGIDGLELSRRLRARYQDDIVLIAVTGRPHDDRRVSLTLDLVDHYLSKPVESAELEKILPRLG